MKVYIKQEGEAPKVISDTFAELPILANPGVTTVEFNTTFLSVAPGTVAFVKEFMMEFVFDGVAWSPYSSEIVGLAATTKPLSPPNGARFREVDGGGKLFIAYGGTWYEQL